MMSTTHAAMGLAGAALLAPFHPELAKVAAVGALAGGVFPDLDLAFQHRKTLHHPELYTVAALVAFVIAAARPGPYTVGVAGFFGSAALHSLSDVMGGGLELRPWEGTDSRGIYLHVSGRWLRARKLIRYDGAPEDLLVVAAFAAPPLLVFDGTIQQVVFIGLGISVVYVAIRKPMVDVYESLLQ